MRQEASPRIIGVTAATALHLAIGWALWSLAAPGVVAPRRADTGASGLIQVRLIRTDANPAQPIYTPVSTGLPRDGLAPHQFRLGSAASAPATMPGATPALRPVAAPLAAVPDTPLEADKLPSAEVMAYRALLEAHLAHYRVYPASARAAGGEGVVILHFITDRHGKVADAWIESSSGILALDKEALEAIARAQPLPPFPGDWPGEVDFSLPVTFKLS